MDIKKRCQWCGEPFIAHKTTTLYCSKLCIDRAYKAKEKEKIKEEKLNELSSTFPIVESIGQKPFMTPREAAKLLGIGKTTMYRYMAQGIIKVFRTPARTIVRRSDLEALFDNAPAYVKRVNKKHKVDSETYTMRDLHYWKDARTCARTCRRSCLKKMASIIIYGLPCRMILS